MSARVLARSTLLGAALWGGFAPPVAAQREVALMVEVRAGQSIRDVAAEYLGDPDLWGEILRVNDLASAADVSTGMRLRMPAKLIAAATAALAAADEGIQQANAAGARLFAQEMIADAIRLRDRALERRKASDWEGCAESARNARAAASRALDETMAQRRASAEALLADRRGTVERKRATELVWNDASLNAVLLVQERVRTLSASTCQIRFLDEGRLRLGQNSQAVIETVQVDRLTKDGEANVSLVEGDVHALLGGNRQKRRFNLAVPGVKTRFDSSNFWVSHDRDASRFANYDERDATITARGTTVTLRRNEGTRIAPTGPLSVRLLLNAPRLQTPLDDAMLSQRDVDLTWSLVAGARAFWIEVARDQVFDRVTLSRRNVPGTQLRLSGLADGTYYWRVATLDDWGLPGPKTAPQRFTVAADAYAPYLVLRAPADNAIVRSSTVRVIGETEPGITVALGGRAIDIGADGRFDVEHALAPGVNDLRVEARDNAGHVTERRRSVILMPDAPVSITYAATVPRVAPRRFLTARPIFTLSGTVSIPRARIHVRGGAGEMRVGAYANDAGRFAANVPVVGDAEELTLVVTSPSGFVAEEAFSVQTDRDPPTLTMDVVPPATTREARVRLAGRVGGAVELRVNGRPAGGADGRFDERLELAEGGNDIEIRAADAVGSMTLDRWHVLVDRQPPELLAPRVTPVAGSDGLFFEVAIDVRDASAVQQTARVELARNGVRRSGVLQLDGSGRRYRGVVHVPGAPAEPVRLRWVTVADYLGNTHRYELP